MCVVDRLTGAQRVLVGLSMRGCLGEWGVFCREGSLERAGSVERVALLNAYSWQSWKWVGKAMGQIFFARILRLPLRFLHPRNSYKIFFANFLYSLITIHIIKKALCIYLRRAFSFYIFSSIIFLAINIAFHITHTTYLFFCKSYSCTCI